MGVWEWVGVRGDVLCNWAGRDSLIKMVQTDGDGVWVYGFGCMGVGLGVWVWVWSKPMAMVLSVPWHHRFETAMS